MNIISWIHSQLNLCFFLLIMHPFSGGGSRAKKAISKLNGNLKNASEWKENPWKVSQTLVWSREFIWMSRCCSRRRRHVIQKFLPSQLCKVTSSDSESIFLLLISVIDVSRKQICVRKLFKLLKSSKVFLRFLINELLQAALRQIVLAMRWKHFRNIYFNCFVGLFKLNKYLCTIKLFSPDSDWIKFSLRRGAPDRQ